MDLFFLTSVVHCNKFNELEFGKDAQRSSVFLSIKRFLHCRFPVTVSLKKRDRANQTDNSKEELKMDLTPRTPVPGTKPPPDLASFIGSFGLSTKEPYTIMLCPSCVIVIGVVLHQQHLCTLPPGTWLDIETSYLVYICTYVPHVCTSNI